MKVPSNVENIVSPTGSLSATQNMKMKFVENFLLTTRNAKRGRTPANDGRPLGYSTSMFNFDGLYVCLSIRLSTGHCWQTSLTRSRLHQVEEITTSC